MEHRTENNCLVENKKKRRKRNIKHQNNKVTQKLTGDQKDKLLNMTKSHYNDLCSSSNQSNVFSKSNTSTVQINIIQNGKQFNTKNLFCSDLNESKIVKPNDFSHINRLKIDYNKILSANIRLVDKRLSSGFDNVYCKSIENSNLKLPCMSMNQFVDCGNNCLVRCRYCHTMICFDDQLLSKHSIECRQFIETKFNYIKQFNCFVCDITANCLKNWKAHVTSTSHLDKCLDINDYVSYECDRCKAIYFGSKEKILNHCKTVHKNPSGLPSVFKLMQEVFHEFMNDSQKRWTFCSPCKEYSRILNIQSSQFNCLNHKNKKTNHFKCNTCSIDFICSQIVYSKHLISCEHFMLEHLRSKIKGVPDFQSVCNLKLPQIFLNKFNIDHEKTTCNDCKLQIVPDEKAITVHLTNCILKSDIGGKNTLNIQKYFCKLCDEIISDFSQWKYHLISPNHLIKCHNIIDLVSYTCETCSLHCYGNAHYATDHQQMHPNNSEYNLSKFIAFNYKRINNNLTSKDYYYCEGCETYAEVNSSDHWNKSHLKKLKRLVCLPCRTEFFCIEGNNLFERHTLSNEHILLKYVFTKNTSVESKPNLLDKSQKLNELNDKIKNSDSKDVSKVLENSLPFIIKPYSNWFIEAKNKAVCISCDEILDTNENALLSHLLVCKQYSTKNMFEMSINYFKCLECSFYSNVYESWKTHVISHVILDLYDKYSYFCKICNSLLYGKMSNIEVHLNNEHSTVLSEMPLETALLAKQLTRRYNNPCKSQEIMCVCEPCNKIFKVLENPNHFNTDRHLSVASDIVELFYCKYCLVEFYSPNTSIELHKYTVEHIILSSKYGELEVKDFAKPLKLDTHLLKFITDQTLYEHTQNIGFFCFICDYICYDLITWKTHINGKKHSHSSKCFPCIDHRCKICKTLMFGKRQHIFEHYNNLFHSMLRQYKKMTLSEKKKKDLFEEESETNLICKTQTTSENNQIIKTEKHIVRKSHGSNKMLSFTKILDKLSIQPNDPLDCSALGKLANDIDRTYSVTKTMDESHLGLHTNQDNDLVNKSSANVIETYSLKNNADKICIKSNTKNFVNFYELKMKILKESLVINKDQLVYYCVPCDYITAVKVSWDNHNVTHHSNEIQVRQQVFCDICSLYQVGPLDNLDKHFKTIEHKNMEDFLKSCKPNDTTILNDTTKGSNENKSNLISDKALNVTTTLVPDKQEKPNNTIDEKEVSNRKTLIEIKGIKAEYKNNGWTEFKKIFVTYGFFRLHPKNNGVIIKFRKRHSTILIMKDKEKLEKAHDFTINVVDEVIEEKLPELQRITVYEFGNKDTLTKIIDSQLLAIDQEISNSDIDKRLINLMNSIHYYAGQYFSNGKIYAFGSRMSGLALKDSDVDLYFDIANTFYGSLSNDLRAQEDLVRYFGKEFRSVNKEFKQVQSITGARVPIVKFFHNPSGLNCDLSFKSGLSTHNTKLVRLYLTLDKHVHWVVCAIVKRWALQNNIKNQTMFSSYALAWLVLFYLMTVKVVPSLKLLRDNAVYLKNATRNAISDEMIIEDWDCTFCTPEKAKQIWNVPKSSCWDLLVNFFNFYSNPNSLNKFVFCPAIGEAVPKEQFIQIPLENPDKLGFNKKKIGTPSQWCAILRKNFSGEGLAVQDPFDLFHNITKIINPRKLRAFSHLCSKTLEVMNRPYYA